MPAVNPFAAVRPKPHLARQICELPYDVMSAEEARRTAADNPLSFLRVSKPEIELPPETDPHVPEVYARGRGNFRRLLAEGSLVQDPRPCYYFYRQEMGQHAQTGLVGAVSCLDYVSGRVRRHELTRPDKEEDRLRHIDALDAQTGPAFLVYRAVPDLDELTAARAAQPPQIDFVAADGVRHTAWVVDDDAAIHLIQAQFEKMPALYVADGHHRTAAAVRLFQSRRGSGHSGSFLAVMFPHSQTNILSYNRVVKDLNGLQPAALLRRLEALFSISSEKQPWPQRKHELALYLAGQWRRLVFHAELTRGRTLADGLDVGLLQAHVLAPLFDIGDPRMSERIGFVGGIRGASELEHLVDSGQHACAFLLHPTSIDDLMAISDAGQLMPPKSTWFEPKLRDGMFSHLLQ